MRLDVSLPEAPAGPVRGKHPLLSGIFAAAATKIYAVLPVRVVVRVGPPGRTEVRREGPGGSQAADKSRTRTARRGAEDAF